MGDPLNDFDAAKAIAQQLTGMEREQQERVLRWVAESLGISTQLILGARQRASAGTASSQERDIPPSAEQRGSLDIKSFVEQKSPGSDVQFAAVVAYYYRFEAPPDARAETIDSERLQDAARLAGRARLVKPHLTLNNAKNLGYLDSPSRGQFSINTVGENLVAMTLPGNSEDQPRRSRQTSARRRKASPKRQKKGTQRRPRRAR